MLKAGRLRWILLPLAGLFLIALWMTLRDSYYGWTVPDVEAAGTQIVSRANACTDWHPSFGRTVIVNADEVVCGDLTSFGGTVAIIGEVQGDVVAFDSNVVIIGVVDGNVNAYGGTVTTRSGSSIHGAINLYGGTLARGSNVRAINHGGNISELFRLKNQFSFPFWEILTWVILGVLLTSLLPEHVMFVRTTAVNKMKRSLGLGLLSVVLAPPILLILIALILTIPLAIIVAMGLITAWALGTVAIGWYIGEQLLQRVAPNQNNSRAVQVAVGLTVLVLAGSLPFIGWLITVGAGLLGLGAVFLSRFGTRLYVQPRQLLTL